MLKPVNWTDTELDHPIPLLHRNKVTGEQMLMARVHLEKGCHVALHQHDSEQIAFVMSGRVKWTVGAEGSPERTEFEMTGGQVLCIPGGVPHGVDALEDTFIIDVLSPVCAMGVDSQKD